MKSVDAFVDWLFRLIPVAALMSLLLVFEDERRWLGLLGLIALIALVLALRGAFGSCALRVRSHRNCGWPGH